MSPEMESFLCLKTLPARLTAEQAGWVLGFSGHDIPILVAAKLLKPLGRPAYNGTKYFLTAELEALRGDGKWFTKASDAVVDYWRVKNSRKNLRKSVQGARP